MTFFADVPDARTALIDVGTNESVTFGQVRERGAAAVDPIGEQRRLLFLLAANDVFSVTVYAGALQAGHPVVLLDPRTSADRLADLVAAYRPGWVAGPPDLPARLAEAGPGHAGQRVIATDGGVLVETAHPEPPELHPELAVLLTTSGTTGSRKLVRLSARNVAANAASIAEALGLVAGDRPITSLPLHYSFGLSVLNSHWYRGAAVVLTGASVLQRQFWEHVDEHRCTSLAGVPFTFNMLERAGFRQMSLASLTTLQQAGGALDRELTRTYAEHMAARGGALHVMYGQTEATARMAHVPPERLLDKLGSAGVAIPGGTLTIEPGPGGDSGESEGERDGEVVYRGPNVMLGYATDHTDLARGDDLGGTLRTGDLGRIDSDGFLFLSGRSARLAKVFGLRLNLDDVERALATKGPAATVGGSDVIWGFCAFGDEESLVEDARRLSREYRVHPSAFRLRRVPEIPATSSGKVDYERVRQWIP